MIEAPDYLPLGSVVSMEGNPKKLLIVGRALDVENKEGKHEYYDYSFCLYPEGLIGGVVAYGNHENIQEVHFEGFQDDENKIAISAIKEAVSQLDIPKAHPEPIQMW